MQTKLLLTVGAGAIAAVLSISTALPISAEVLRFSNVSSMNSAASDGGIKALSTAAAPLSLAAGQNGLVPSAMLVITPNAKVAQPTYQSWMSSEITAAWAAGYRGQGATITLVDDYSSNSFFSGKLDNGVQTLRHGGWTHLEASMIAPSATIAAKDFGSGTKVALGANGLNVHNHSYVMYASAICVRGDIVRTADEVLSID